MKVTIVSKQGKEAAVAILGTNDFFCEGYRAGQIQRIATVATMTDSVIVRLEKAVISFSFRLVGDQSLMGSASPARAENYRDCRPAHEVEAEPRRL
jgi:CRP-like cAMP-binding protein